MRGWLVSLIVLATVGFVIGTSIERGNTHDESAAHKSAEQAGEHTEGTGTEPSHTDEASGESAESHPDTAGASGSNEELRPLGIDIEAVPFIVLAALASLGLATLGWTRPRWLPGLVIIALAMLLFAALDVREVFHQSDEEHTGLAILAAVVAALHFAAAALAAGMAARSRPQRSAPAGTIPA